jgi:hypothetical protein
MKRLALIAVALAVTADAGRFDRINSRCVGGRSDRVLACEDLAFFEFAPSNGAGMGSACACAAVTGAKGEALTFTRTGDATCSRQGLATTGINNGDLTVCTGNQPRVEPSGGVLGLRVEGARTSSVLRSQEVDNASWVTVGVLGPAAPTITANAATAPDGTLTADRVQVNACAPVGSASAVYQNYTGTAAAWSGTLYVRGNGSGGTLNLYYFDTTAALGNAVNCNYVSASWTRCDVPRTFANTTHRFGFGCVNDAVISGSGNTGAADVFVWGAQSEVGAYATSYIPTVASATTRNAESATFPVALSTANNFSWAESLVSPSTLSACAGFFPFFSSPNGPVLYSCFNTGIIARVQEAANVADSPTCVFSAFKWQTGVRWGGVWNRSASTTQCHVDGVTGAAGTPNALVGSVSFSPVGLNSGADGIHSRVCVDPDPTRCR